MRYVLLGLVVASLSACDFIGGGDTVVRGNDNLVVRNPTQERISKELARFDTVPQVSDADIQQMYSVVREKALEGELEAMLIVLRLAAIQRQPVEEDEN